MLEAILCTLFLWPGASSAGFVAASGQGADGGLVHEWELAGHGISPMRGPEPRAIVHRVEQDGRLFVRTYSEGVDLRVELLGPDGELLAEAVDGGPHFGLGLSVEVRAGQEVEVRLTVVGGRGGAVRLELVAAPESPETLGAAAHARELLDQARGELARSANEPAAELLAAAVESLLAVPGGERSEAVAHGLREAGALAVELERPDLALQAAAARLANLERTRPPDDAELLRWRFAIAYGRIAFEQYAAARDAWAELVGILEGFRAPEDPELLTARHYLGYGMCESGLRVEGCEIQRAVLDLIPQGPSEESPTWSEAVFSRMSCLGFRGRFAELRDEGLEALARFESAGMSRHAQTHHIRFGLAEVCVNLGDLELGERIARELLTELLKDAPEDLVVGSTEQLLAMLLGRRLAWEDALELLRSAVQRQERDFGPEHPMVLSTQAQEALVLRQLGEMDASRRLVDKLTAAVRRAPPGGSLGAGKLKLHMAILIAADGDLGTGADWIEDAIEELSRHLPPHHLLMQQARQAAGMISAQRGDLSESRSQLEASLAAHERTLPPGHATIQTSRLSLAGVLSIVGELDGALALIDAIFEQGADALEPQLRLEARQARAGVLASAGRTGEALEILEELLAERAPALPTDHPDLAQLRQMRALVLREHGEPELALLAVEELLAQLDAAPILRSHERGLRMLRIVALHELGDAAAARAGLGDFLELLVARARRALTLAPRQALEILASDGPAIALVLHLADAEDDALRRGIFELVELRRAVGVVSARTAGLAAADEGLASLNAANARARAELAELLLGGRPSELSADAYREQVATATRERDQAEAAIALALAERGLFALDLDADSLARRLAPGSAAVGFLRYTRAAEDDEGSRLRPGGDHLLAHVLLPGGGPLRLELGPMAELQALVSDWRTAIGQGTAQRGLGIAVDELGAAPDDLSGESLRARLLDPLLAAAGPDVERLYVCADDLVYLVPLDALPLEPGLVVGDRHQIVLLPSFHSLLEARAAPAGEPSLLVLGGVDYDALGRQEDPAGTQAPPGFGSESAPAFEALPGAAQEARALAELFSGIFYRRAEVLERRRATKSRLQQEVAGRRYVHLATHGWFAPETVASMLDGAAPLAGSWVRRDLREEVRGFAPMVLCGLALTGANRGRDGAGRVPGILTAEELSTFDLSACRLAVLSACETQVGERRAGLGIQSLQAALHAAGARSTVTSLWKVDDHATVTLMGAFYRYLWAESLSPAEALWRAKLDLRRAGHPPRDWAPWVLSGLGE